MIKFHFISPSNIAVDRVVRMKRNGVWSPDQLKRSFFVFLFFFSFFARFYFSGANLVGFYFVISDSSKVRKEWIIKMDIVLENVEV